MAAYAGIPHPQKRDLEVIAKLPFLSLDSLHLCTVNSNIVDRKLTALTPCQGAAGNCWS